MSLKTRSAFIYGYTVDDTQLYIDFSEGSGELTATLDVNDYTMTDIATEMARAMTEAGGQTYSVIIDRATRKYTISAPSSFDLLVSSGSHVGTAIWDMIGMNGVDKIGLLSYESDKASGTEYLPQFLLQNYIGFNDYETAVSGSVNESANGDIEVVSFGNINFAEFNIKFATDVNQGESTVIENNANGVSELRLFMQYCITKGVLEFIPDKNAPNTYSKTLLESTSLDKNGIGFKLYEMYGRGLPNYYETKNLKWRLL